jgi:hypothetical protein
VAVPKRWRISPFGMRIAVACAAAWLLLILLMVLDYLAG